MPVLKRLVRIAFLWLGPLVVASVGLWMYANGGDIVSTDNAYLKTEMVSISSELGGKVVAVLVQDNERVKAGQLLLRIDDENYRIALARAEANLLKVRSTIESLRADYVNKQADIDKARNDYDYFRKEAERLQKASDRDSIPAIQRDQAAHQASASQKELESTRQALEVVKARLVDPALPIEQHPDYQLALVERDKAALDLTRIEVHAPIDGVLANFNVKVGEVVNASIPLFSLVNDSRVWVEANLKETDLTWLRLGQPATIHIDAYPGLEWQGKVVSLTPGTGSEFSLLPPQNSSGNWVKVVQRLNVKLEMTPLADSPVLATGMSALVEVDTGHKRQLPWQ
ncbi:MAG: HlyD family secretion protein [Pseudomonadota bacterium]